MDMTVERSPNSPPAANHADPYHADPHHAARGPLRLALTPGCAAGVGPELWAAVLAADGHTAEGRGDAPVLHWMGSAALLLRGAARAGVVATRAVTLAGTTVTLGHTTVHCHVSDADDPARTVEPGAPTPGALVAQRDALLHAIALADAGRVDAIVTGPIRKAALADVHGKSYPGHTELLHAHLAAPRAPGGLDEPLMCFAGGPFVLGLCTVHLPLANVAAAITPARVEQQLRALIAATARLEGRSPHAVRTVVLGLNPHAGEDGLLGTEERDVIAPAIAAIRAEGYDVTGPVPADGFFGGLHRPGPAVHAVLAMSHDQGLGPYKLLARGQGVNITWGLRVPRTSPDHGTADALAGTGTADPTSLAAALARARALAPR